MNDQNLQGPVPSPLDADNGTRIRTAFEWCCRRRPEIWRMLSEQVYGNVPPLPDEMAWEVLRVRDDALDGTAVRKEIRLHFRRKNGLSRTGLMLLYLPKDAAGPVPVFLGLNFRGNRSCTHETDVLPSDHYDEDSDWTGRWQFEQTIRRGYASATVCYQDFFADRADGFQDSIYQLFPELQTDTAPHPRYTAIGAWAWGLSRMLDALSSEVRVDVRRAAVHGHSRLGKTALWAGACDARFRIVISNDSGCGGASLSRHLTEKKETVQKITQAFPHWFVSKYGEYSGQVDAMPFDQHFLLSLIAPRICCVGSAEEDLWADPKGEFLSCVHASEVYRLFGADGIGVGADAMPAPGGGAAGQGMDYHIRPGGHDQNLEDWMRYWDVADRIFS